MTGTAVGTPSADSSRRASGQVGRRGRKWGPPACGVLLAVPAALLTVRLTGLDEGTALAVPIVLFPYCARAARPPTLGSCARSAVTVLR